MLLPYSRQKSLQNTTQFRTQGTKVQAPTYVHKNPLTLKYAVIMDDILLAHYPTQSSPQFILEI